MKNTVKSSFVSIAVFAAMIAGCGGISSANLDHEAPVVPSFHYADEQGRPIDAASKDDAKIELILASLEKAARVRKSARAGERNVGDSSADAARAGEAAINDASADAARAGNEAVNEATADAAATGNEAVNEATADAAAGGNEAVNEAAADAAAAGNQAINEATADAAATGNEAVNEAAADAASAGNEAINEATADAAAAGNAAVNESSADAASAGEAGVNEADADAARAGTVIEPVDAERLRARVAGQVEPSARNAQRARPAGTVDLQAADAMRAPTAGALEPSAEPAQSKRVALRHRDGQAVRWGEFRRAWGHVQVSCEPAGTRLSVNLYKLIPGGTYSGALSFFRAPGFAQAHLDALAKQVELDSKFAADEQGSAKLEAFVPADDSASCLLESNEVHLTVSYHQGSFRAPQLSWMIDNGWASARSPWTVRAGSPIRSSVSPLD